MRRFIASLLLATGILCTSALAEDIAVYRGSARIAVSAQLAANFTPTVRVYWIVNYDTGEMGQILYYNKLGKKKTTATTNWRVSTVTLPNSKSGTVLVTGSTSNTAADDFTFATLMLRGQNVALLIETNPAKRTIERPRALTGKILFVDADLGEETVLQDGTFAATLDAAKTISANNGNKSLATVLGEIAAQLTEQGYQGN